MAEVDALGEDAAAFIFEPLILGSGGMLMYDASAFDSLLAHCRAKGILLIADEVMTGFGRTGTNFAMDQLSTPPDMITLSKGLTGGTMAMGITTCTADIYEAFLSNDKTKTLFHGHSYTANPLTCAAALASLELFLDPACGENRQRIAGQHEAFAKTLEKQAFVKNVRQTGTILAFEVDTGEADSYVNNLAGFLHAFFREKRVMLRPSAIRSTSFRPIASPMRNWLPPIRPFWICWRNMEGKRLNINVINRKSDPHGSDFTI